MSSLTRNLEHENEKNTDLSENLVSAELIRVQENYERSTELRDESLSGFTNASPLQSEKPSMNSMDEDPESHISNLLPQEKESISVGNTEDVRKTDTTSHDSPACPMQDIKKKMPGLTDLTVPTSPDPSGIETSGTGASSSDSDSSEACPPVIPPLMRRISIQGRLKTRLQDPPPLTPGVQNQLSHCSSSLLRRRSSLAFAVPVEQQTARLDSGSTSMASFDGVETLVVQPVDGVAADPLSSKVTSNVPPVLEEDHDPLDDENIPASKKRKTQGNRWILFTQWFGLILLVAFLVCCLEIPVLTTVTFAGLHLWRWAALTLVVLCGRLISGWIVKLLVMLIEKHYILKKRVLYFVYGLRCSVKNCVWLALVLGVWETIFQGLEETKAVNYLTKILWCLFIAAVSWMFKVLAVKVAASSFHRTAYFERIQDCIFNQYLLEKLSGPSTMEGIVDDGDDQDGYKKQMTRKEKRKHRSRFSGPQNLGSSKSKSMQEGLKRSRRISKQVVLETPGHTTVEVGEVPISACPDTRGRRVSVINQGPLIARSPIPIEQEKLQELTSDTVSVWTLKRLMKLIRKTNISTYSSIISQETDDGEINSELQAKAAAKQIFYNMARPGQKSLMMKDFLYFLSEDQAARAFGLFETNETGEITKRALTKWVVAAYKERRALALTLNDNRTVVAKLHKVLNVILSLALVIVFVLVFGVETSKLLVFFSSVFIPSVFVFGNAARTTFESLIFLFVTHPFDVGDRVVVDGQNMLVEEMNVLNTIFLGPANEKVYFPNSLLSMKAISNYYRSPDQGDAIEFQIHMNTPVEKLGQLKERMQRYIESLPQFWYPDFKIVCDRIQDSNKMFMAVWLRHRLNYQDGGERFQRRSNMILYFKQQLEDLGIGYQLPGQEITVTGVPLRNT